MCSTSRIDPVARLAGILAARAMLLGNRLKAATPPDNCKNLRRSILGTASPSMPHLNSIELPSATKTPQLETDDRLSQEMPGLGPEVSEQTGEAAMGAKRP